MVSTSRGVSRRLFSVFSMFLLVVPLISLQQPSNNVVQAEASNKGAEAKRAEETAIYVIYPQNFRDKSQADAINKLLDETVSDPTKIYASEVNGDGMWTLFWNAALTESQAAAIKADTNVGSIGKSRYDYDPSALIADDSPHKVWKRDQGLTRQRDAVDEMRFISQPLDLSITNYKDYVYDASAGEGVTVYVSDTGANITYTSPSGDTITNPEFSQGTNVAQRVRWIFAQGGGVTPNFDQTDTGIHVPHGTCMLDKVAGNKYGVAKKVNPVVVRVPNQTPEAYLDTVRRIRADYEPIHDQNPTTARTIINMSWGFTREQLGEGFLQWVEELAGLLQLLISKGALVVVPSGNGPPGNLPINQYPQKLAGQGDQLGVPDQFRVPQLLVVGGVMSSGQLWERSRTAEYISIYGPSFIISCANGTGGLRNREEVTGVSLAAAQVSGLATYFLGLSSLQETLHDDTGLGRVLKLKNFLESSAWDRVVPQGPHKALYNLEDPRECPAIEKRDDDGDAGPCDTGYATTGTDITAMSDCYITTTTLAASESAGPVMGCVCAGLMIAGMDSTVVGGTTYTWCQTGGPPVYPTDIQASTAPSTPKPAPAAPTTMSTAISSPVVASTDGCNKEDASPLEIGDSCEKQ